MERIGSDERRRRLAQRHRLASEAHSESALDTAIAVVALHSSDAATVFLSTWARTRGFEVGDLERALYDERSLVRLLGMRRTLWVVPRELAEIVHAACTRTIAARERTRLEGFVARSGVSDDPGRWLDDAAAVALRVVEERGEAFTGDLSRAEPLLATKLRLGAGTRWEASVSAGSRILPLLAAEGALARGRPRTSWTNAQYRWLLVRDWLGEVESVEPAVAQAELLRRWLAAFGPATETDVRWWTGWTARETRAALAAVPHVEVDLDGAVGLVLAGDLEATERPEPWAALLPTLDPTTMGWKEREWYLGPHAAVLFDSNGNAGPTVWWDGRVVGGWSQRRDGEIVFELLEDVGRDAVAAVEAEAARLREWLGEARFSPGFLPLFQRGLAR
ncbi:MAG: winged helix DNA-binding domain-containing protein [Actinobacteria bacterium]|nr:winged helix DNA-binding domain-containing protein [Actinomycetota bacterium]